MKDHIKDKRALINAGLHYLSTGREPKSEVRPNKKVIMRLKLSPVGERALNDLLSYGYTRTEAFTQAALYLFDHPMLLEAKV